MLTKEEAKARVARGSAALDVIRPGWERQIDVGLLDLKSCARCMLGQLRAWFDVADDLQAYGFMWRNPDGLELGSVAWAEAYHHDYALLQDYWIATIADRLVPQPVSEQAAECLAAR